MQEQPLVILKQFWGYSEFRGSQEDIIQNVMANRDTIALLPTGGGKSICYQIPALARDGICIVISPLVALIQDQISSLKDKGIKCTALLGGMSFEEVDHVLDNCIYGNYKFLYLSPERLQQELVQDRIKQMPVNCIAIDEAHCISVWGQDFRPAYLKCSILRALHATTPIVALTATATEQVIVDIKNALDLTHVNLYKDSFARKNIAFSVVQAEDTYFQMVSSINSVSNSTIVYTRTRKSTLQLQNYLQQKGITVQSYHGGLTQTEKKERLNLWLTNKVKVMVATNAFGMGIDKADVGLVIHFHLPDSLENYFQEAGRAGRNGLPAKAILYNNAETIARTQKQFIDQLPTIAFLKLLFRKVCSYLQIAYGEGSGEEYGINLNEFSLLYKLNPGMVYNGLRMLDQNAIIQLQQQSVQRTIIQFTANKYEVFEWLEANPSLATVTQTILRTYGGVFEFETHINPNLIAKKTNSPLKKIENCLTRLKIDGLISYNAKQEDLTLRFLVPREDDLTINSFADKVAKLNETKIQKLKQMIAYAVNSRVCRQQFLLRYFGETSEPCGTCDICLKQVKAKQLKPEIIFHLSKQPLSSRELSLLVAGNPEQILGELRELLEDGTLTLSTDNRYHINGK